MSLAFSRVISLPGNHDLMMVASGDAEFRLAEGASGGGNSRQGANWELVVACLRKNIEELKGSGRLQDIQAWIEQSPYIHSPLEGVYLTHGTFNPSSRHDTMETYFDNLAVAETSWGNLTRWLGQDSPTTDVPVIADAGWSMPRLLLMGHSHTQLAWRRHPSDGKEASWEALDSGFGWQPNNRPGPVPLPPHAGSEPFEIVLDCPLIEGMAGAVTAINPGSVGLPRDGASAGDGLSWAKYALIDWDPPGGRVAFRWVPYENAPLLKKLVSFDYPREIAARLQEP
jgi:hypothetical protein